MRGLFEITLKRGYPAIASRMLTLCKCVDHRQWFFEHPLRQFAGDKLSLEILDKLENKQASLERLRDMTQDEIGMCICADGYIAFYVEVCRSSYFTCTNGTRG